MMMGRRRELGVRSELKVPRGPHAHLCPAQYHTSPNVTSRSVPFPQKDVPTHWTSTSYDPPAAVGSSSAFHAMVAASTVALTV